MIGDRYVLCMRIQGGKPLQLSSGEFGWLHTVAETPTIMRCRKASRELEETSLNVAAWIQSISQRYTDHSLETLANLLGVSEKSLDLLECKLAKWPDTYAFPMRNGRNGLVGVRLRNLKGQKWAVKGSHQGLFIPQQEPKDPLMIVEGPTDCAAALTLGYHAIGRPSCSGGVFQILDYLKLFRIRRVVIMSDLDDPGMRGADTLGEHLPVCSATLLCPCKDIRSYLNYGGDKQTLDAVLNQLVWRQPKE